MPESPKPPTAIRDPDPMSATASAADATTLSTPDLPLSLVCALRHNRLVGGGVNAPPRTARSATGGGTGRSLTERDARLAP
ncbi:hypothetical protein QE366_002682 [Nocardioides zeae]|nr:hypothetical protein [Nocardioides zeae]